MTDGPGLAARLRDAGLRAAGEPYAVGTPGLRAPRGDVPPDRAWRPAAGPEVREVAIKVESVAAFSRAHDLGLDDPGLPARPVPGRPGRRASATSLAVGRAARAISGFEPFPGELAREGRMTPHAARDALAARELWQGRRRRFDDDAEGFDATEATLDRVIELAGVADLACHLVFEVERDYWQSRNRAARVQKARQDRLGLGWANHDHHTFRCSRRFFPRVIGMFERSASSSASGSTPGEHAGWGAQILEHPTTGIVIFADLDLAPDEATHDFAHQALPDLPRPNTVGLWVGLHGESILEAGHAPPRSPVRLRRPARRPQGRGRDRDHEAVLRLPLPPPGVHRRRALAGRPPPRRPPARPRAGSTPTSTRKFLREGAIGSHLENLQRREGYKGFNQQAVSAIIAATDPRLH